MAVIQVVETEERVPTPPALVTRFGRRAERRRRDLEALRDVPFFRWHVVREGGRYLVVALQNRAYEG